MVHSDEPVTLRLDARGPADVTAADIQPHPDVEVLNGDLAIATPEVRPRKCGIAIATSQPESLHREIALARPHSRDRN